MTDSFQAQSGFRTNAAISLQFSYICSIVSEQLNIVILYRNRDVCYFIKYIINCVNASVFITQPVLPNTYAVQDDLMDLKVSSSHRSEYH
jgi:hypothetical protein